MIFEVGVALIKNRTYSMYSDRQALANSENPDQTPQYAASDQGLHCLHSSSNFMHIHR